MVWWWMSTPLMAAKVMTTWSELMTSIPITMKTSNVDFTPMQQITLPKVMRDDHFSEKGHQRFSSIDVVYSSRMKY
ncbi:hypothetical protein L2E82_32631 [Cichorium intybus]|uniref:Uncharacterized protein n=1 Tax=Cichorium intybus TaxID=13427 RepID=A0ACB9BJ30_CICIN|nr:hypothetical protein L2E82_32631 [Cichorium intybus]